MLGLDQPGVRAALPLPGSRGSGLRERLEAGCIRPVHNVCRCERRFVALSSSLSFAMAPGRCSVRNQISAVEGNNAEHALRAVRAR